MLTRKQRTRYQALKSTTFTVLAGAGLLQAALVVFAAERSESPAIVPLVRINPEYPQQALAGNMEGWVQLEFTITETGAVADPVVVDSAACPNGQGPESCRSDDMFKSTALDAIAKWRYAPLIVDGEAVSRPGVQTIIRFALEDPEKSEP